MRLVEENALHQLRREWTHAPSPVDDARRWPLVMRPVRLGLMLAVCGALIAAGQANMRCHALAAMIDLHR